jgi:4'-phosphopantetheinyl transferase
MSNPHLLSKLSFRPREAHIWLAETLVATKHRVRLKSFLSETELERSTRFYTEDLQNSYITVRGLLREILGQYLKISPASVQFAFNAFEKPCLHPIHRSELFFNLSHSGTKLVVALSEKTEIGIDVEKISSERVCQDTARTLFTSSELEQWLALSTSNQTQAFYNAWTRKEAFMKALGEGLSFGFENLEVAFDPFSSAELISVNGMSGIDSLAKKWKLFDLKIDANYAGAVVTEAATETLVIHEWSSAAVSGNRSVKSD